MPALPRRSFVLGLVGGGALGLVVSSCKGGASNSLDLSALLPGAAREVGQAAKKAGVARPRAELEKALSALPAGDDNKALLAAVRARIAGDLAAGRLVRVEGWRLAQTEVDLCAALVELS